MLYKLLVFLAVLAYPFLFKFLEYYFSKKGEGLAIKEDAREIKYEETKGENLATKEDIEDLTRKIETVRNEISFENQRKHEFINQRTDRLTKVLYLTEKLNNYQSILLFSLYNKYSAPRLLKLIEEINETLLLFIHESRMLWITVKDDDLSKRITNLIKTAQEYASFMCYIASCAAACMADWNDYLELAKNNDNNKTILSSAIESKSNLESVKQDFENGIQSRKDALHDCQIKYLSKLNILFGSDFHLSM
ncbi:hypothetical protein LJC39_01615 [Parabacteroides sp. OttesenSCG-928-B22]|nr:hypothetical protein [Parabacteroides sp. OttesenSCG-928-B22]